MSRKQSGAAFELVFAAALWGFGFIAMVWALRSMGPLAITGWRFVIAAAVSALIVLMKPSLWRDVNWQQFRLAAVPGILLCITLIFQTWGLKYTTATKSGLITTLYVLIVPIFDVIFLKRKQSRFHYFYVFVSLIGVSLICDFPALFNGHSDPASLSRSSSQNWNIGDLLTFICACAASVQIFWFALISKKIGSAFVFNGFQSIWAGVIPLVLSFFLEPAPSMSLFTSPSSLPLIGLLSLALGSTVIGFGLQVRAQKILSPSLASLLYLLESPFATVFAIYFLGESLAASQWFGAGLVLMAATLSTAFNTEASEPPSPSPLSSS